ncbi:hypothetical protein EW146_g9551 [Bondarzewia mesenterica]|uniref:GAG-pre-integrase domain-containing protein n=1 Tax=Bondarzewia mesenterica TaxID=1095465 RepID=A0A4S4L5H9_9AGAM|nr:hypothetical protein EW146_g9551 [Bondarzewia mesenterica]
MGDKYSVQFNDQQCFVHHKTGSQKLVATGICTANNLYRLNGTPTPTSLLPSIAASASAADLDTWHHCLGHVNVQSIMHMAHHGLASAACPFATLFATNQIPYPHFVTGVPWSKNNSALKLAFSELTMVVSAPYTSAHMGEVERAHRMLMDRTHAILSDLCLPPSLWAECLATACYLKNQTPMRALSLKTPWEMWSDSRPDLSHLRELGAHSVPHSLQPGRLVNLDPPSFVPPSPFPSPPLLPDSSTLQPVSPRDIPSALSSPHEPLLPSRSSKRIPKISECLAASRSLPYTTLLEQAVADSHLARDHIRALGQQSSTLPSSDIDAPPLPSDPDDPDVPMMLAIIEEIHDEPRTWSEA